MVRFVTAAAGGVLALLAIASPSAVAAGGGSVAVHLRGDRLVAEIPVSGSGEMCGTAELLDTLDVARWRGATRGFADGAGVLAVPIELTFSSLGGAEQAELTWYRLRYRVGPCGEERVPMTVSMSNVFHDAFELRARGSPAILGKTHRLWVSASRLDGEPLAGVAVEASLGESCAAGTTGPDGSLALEVVVPEREVQEANIKVVGTLGHILREVTLRTYAGWAPSVLMSTDKAIYQPGQTLHVRALLLAPSGQPRRQRDVSIRVRGPDRGLVFRKRVTTTSYGVATADWAIPNEAPTGSYDVFVTPVSEGDEPLWNAVTVEIYRYDLPTFTVSIKPVRPYVLAGERAAFEVRATYLSGQPMRHFTTKIVKPRNARRLWTPEGESSAEAVASGMAGPDGVFRAALDLPAVDETSGWRFEDTQLMAYVTDESTGRAERRSFQLRSTLDPIHVYAVGALPRDSALESPAYLSTSYADGTPAQCEVEIQVDGKPFQRVTTNRFGVARTMLRLPEGALVSAIATDRAGLRGQLVEGQGRYAWGWWRAGSGADEVRVTVGKTLHRRGEPIELEIDASFDYGLVLVDIARDLEFLDSVIVPINRRKGRVSIPFRPVFRGSITLSAYSAGLAFDGAAYRQSSQRVVFYPDDRRLVLKASLSRKAYRPGEMATARLALKRTDGTPVVGAMGVAVVDRAVEERALDDSLFGRGWTEPDPFTGPYRFLLDGEDELAGFRLSDFQRLLEKKTTEPVPADVELVAEVMLNRWPGYVAFLQAASSSEERPRFELLFEKSLSAFRRRLVEDERRLPRNDVELCERLAEAGLSPPADPWGTPYRFEFDYSPSTRFDVLQVLSAGPDTTFGTPDDEVAGNLRVFSLRREEREMAEATARDRARLERRSREFTVRPFVARGAMASPSAVPVPTAEAISNIPPQPAPIGVRGTVKDEDGQDLPGVLVTCWNMATGEVRSSVTNASGEYAFSPLPEGAYVFTFELQGFRKETRADVTVSRGRTPEALNVELKLLAVATEVAVTAEASVLETRATVSSSAMSRPGDSSAAERRSPKPYGAVGPMRTPRLRELFPETVLWAPLLETTKAGEARLRFRLADNITTWTLFAVGSSERGEVGFARVDFGSSQPFFVEHDPPRILTVGDEIELPVVVRNYRPRDQRAELAMSEAPWYRLLGTSRREVTVPANDSRTEAFRFRAERAVAAGKQRITAQGLGEPRDAQPADAIEKPVLVRRNAEEKAVSRGAILSGPARIALDVPKEALRDTLRATLTIHPNLGALLSESLEAVLERPHGCAEQTISTAYPSLLLLRYLRARPEHHRPALEARTAEYLRSGVERLRSYQAASGGFSYFGSGAPDVGLTAYAARFLLDASPLGATDERLFGRALDWLLLKQRPDGSWDPREFGSGDGVQASAANALRRSNTGVAAYVLARSRDRTPATIPAVQRAFAYLDSFIKDGDAYLVSTYALAALEAGDLVRADAALERLRGLAQSTSGESHWAAGEASPYGSWGRAGDLEATALAVRALLRREQLGPAGHDAIADRALANGAVAFLFQERDRHGVWFSGHATARALEALLLATDRPSSSSARELRVRVNGEPLEPIELPEASDALEPIKIDLSARVQPGPLEVSVATANGPTAMLHLSVIYSVPWSEKAPSPDLALSLTFDRKEARVGEDITAHVIAARKSRRGNGMLLAEIGIPPGAEVDRWVLTELTSDYRGRVYRYEVETDRVVFYLWPWSTDDVSDFSFRFHLRYPIKALSAPSTLVDYYNPEARVVLPPERFVAR